MKDWCLEVWGNYACFTRPEMKVERVSYDVITPSAARHLRGHPLEARHPLACHQDRGAQSYPVDFGTAQ